MRKITNGGEKYEIKFYINYGHDWYVYIYKQTHITKQDIRYNFSFRKHHQQKKIYI